MTVHPFEPFYNEDSEILILGSFPSVRSREAGFYYAHKNNRFWSVLAYVYGSDTPHTVDEKKAFLKKHRIALWDVIESCDIEKSSDSSVRNVKVNDVKGLLEKMDIKRVFTNGALASRLYNTHIYPITGVRAVNLPSTSSANASWSFERLKEKWAEEINRAY